MSLPMDRISRFNRLALTLMLTLTWIGPGTVGRAASPPADPSGPVNSTPDWTPQDAGRSADGLEHVYRDLEVSLKQLPRKSFDIAARSATLDKTPVALFDFVRTQTMWVPYSGSLRGSIGVMMDRVGNSLDRSLLLADLLVNAGFTARLAHVKLSAEQAAGLIEQLCPKTVRAAEPTMVKPPVVLDPADSQKLKSLAEELEIEGARRAEETATRVSQETPAILDSVEALIGKVPANATERKKVATEAVRDHWWVQISENGAWKDLDPVLPDGKPFVALAAASETILLRDEKGKALRLDSSHTQEVVLRVVAEKFSAAGPQEAVVLEQTLRASDLYGKRVTLHQQPIGWPAETQWMFRKDAQEHFIKSAGEVKEWVPVLGIGDRIVQKGIFDSGELDPNPNLDPMAKVGAAVKQTLGGFGEALGGPAPVKDPTRLSAEWLEFVVKVPGEPDRTIRREIFDLIGPDARSQKQYPTIEKLDSLRLDRAIALFGRSEILITGGRPSVEYTQNLIASSILEQKQSATKLLRAAAQNKEAEALDESTKVNLIPTALYAFPLLRHEWSRLASVTYLARPNIVCFSSHPFRNAAGDFSLREGLDIVANDIALIPGSDRDEFASRLEQGVVDTTVEARLVDGRGTLQNTAEAFGRSLDEGNAWTLIRDPSDPKLASLPLSPDARARITVDLKAGKMVLTATAARPGLSVDTWWQIDPVTGRTLGVNDHGEGASMAEYGLILWALFDGVNNAMGCGAFNGKSSNAKSWACVGCAAAVAALTIAGGFALKSLAAAKAAAAGGDLAAAASVSPYATAGAPAAAAGGHLVGAACNAISRYAD